jgi:hypothetical protein
VAIVSPSGISRQTQPEPPLQTLHLAHVDCTTVAFYSYDFVITSVIKCKSDEAASPIQRVNLFLT